ncbi:MAG TPA: helix-turn-helix domain-containing protein [Acidimicrobiales bacterium]|nr:helix-turn-helix domain-containing protein [Acidimicrobiales bacterium]
MQGAAKLIRDVRRRQGLTQAQLARRAGTSQPVISAYEHGRRDPGYAMLRKLVEAAGEQLVVGATPPAFDLAPPADVAEHARRLLDVLSLADAIPRRRTDPVLRAPLLVSR